MAAKGGERRHFDDSEPTANVLVLLLYVIPSTVIILPTNCRPVLDGHNA